MGAPLITRYAPTSPLTFPPRQAQSSSHWWHALGEDDAQSAVVTASGAHALRLALASIPTEGEVLVPAYTCDRAVAAVLAAGDHPRFLDVDPDSGGFAERAFAAALRRAPKAVILTHLFGLAPDSERVKHMAADRSVAVIEDRALLMSASHATRHQADFAVYSFGRGKPLALGGGGAVVARNPERPLQAQPPLNTGDTASLKSLHLWLGRLRDSDLALRLAFLLSKRLNDQSSGVTADTALPHVALTEPSVSARKHIECAIAAASITQMAETTARALSDYTRAFERTQVPLTGHLGARLPHLAVTPALALRTPERNAIVASLASAGVDCPLYWPYSVAERMGHSGFAGAARLARELVFLPLHAQVDLRRANRIANILKIHRLAAFT